jgi:hypothetical protein
MSNPNRDAGLWARLNALKEKSKSTKSNISELQARFKALTGDGSEQAKEESVQPPLPNLEEEHIQGVKATYDEEEEVGKFMEELGSGDFGLERTEHENVDSLLKDANKTIKEANEELPDPAPEESNAEEKTEKQADDDAQSDAADSDHAAEYIEKLLAEISIESKIEGDKAPTKPQDNKSEDDEQDTAQVEEDQDKSSLSILDLPSTPQGTKAQTKPSITASTNDDDALEARLAALTGGSKTNTGITSRNDAEDPTEDPTENWCIICYDDATLKCYGCDGELYCTNCWKEGHTGPDAGMEERRHRAAAYKKDAKKTKGRRQLAS